ncbi:MAG: glycosyltransferase family 2 protein [Candidatus Hodarchaeota archaeon]
MDSLKNKKGKSPFLSIVVPVYNEEDSLEVLYKEIRESVDRLGKYYEVIFVDDGSSDGTFDRLKGIMNEDKSTGSGSFDLRIIRLSRNFGQTAAMQVGFDHARGGVIVSLDADLQNDPSDIPMLLKKLEEGYDVVCGWRKDRKDKSLSRVIPSKVANWLIARITGVPIHDNGCSLRAYRSAVIKAITLYSDMHRVIPAITTLVGPRMAEIVVNHRARKWGTSKYGISRTWKVLSDIITIKMLIHFQHRPILWFTAFGSIFLLSGLGFGLFSFFLLVQGKGSIVYPAASFLFLSLFGALFAWGLLGEFIVDIEKTKNRPLDLQAIERAERDT